MLGLDNSGGMVKAPPPAVYLPISITGLPEPRSEEMFDLYVALRRRFQYAEWHRQQVYQHPKLLFPAQVDKGRLQNEWYSSPRIMAVEEIVKNAQRALAEQTVLIPVVDIKEGIQN